MLGPRTICRSGGRRSWAGAAVDFDGRFADADRVLSLLVCFNAGRLGDLSRKGFLTTGTFARAFNSVVDGDSVVDSGSVLDIWGADRSGAISGACARSVSESV